MAKRPLPKAGKARNMTVNQFTVSKAVNFPELQAAVVSATGGKVMVVVKKMILLPKMNSIVGFKMVLVKLKMDFQV